MLDDKNFTKYMSHHEIDATVQHLANRISEDYKDKDLVLVTVLKGGFILASDLIRYLKVNAEIDFVRLSNQRKERNSTGTVTIVKDISADLRNRHVLIVEQIIDSGRTLKFLYDRIRSAQPATVEVVTLLDKEAKRLVDVPVKYVGKKIEDQFLVGYGLDLEESSRNLPDIYYLKYPN